MLEMARVGLGALGILTTITFAVEPLFLLEAVEEPMSWDQAISTFDEMVDEHHHVDMYWFPHTDRMLTKRNSRLDAPLSRGPAAVAVPPLARRRLPVQHDVRRGDRRGQPRAPGDPADEPAQRLHARCPHLLRRRPPRVRLRAPGRLPGDGVRRPARGRADRAEGGARGPRGLRPPDQLPRRDPGGPRRRHPALDRERPGLLLPRLPHPSPGRPRGVLRADGAGDARPRRPPALGQGAHPRLARPSPTLYPRFADFLAMRDRLDPDRVFANPYLRRVLGD